MLSASILGPPIRGDMLGWNAGRAELKGAQPTVAATHRGIHCSPHIQQLP